MLGMNVFDSLQLVDYIFLNINFYQIIFNDFMHKVKNINLFWLIFFHLITNLQYFLFIILKMSDYDKISLNLSPNWLRSLQILDLSDIALGLTRLSGNVRECSTDSWSANLNCINFTYYPWWVINHILTMELNVQGHRVRLKSTH